MDAVGLRALAQPDGGEVTTVDRPAQGAGRTFAPVGGLRQRQQSLGGTHDATPSAARALAYFRRSRAAVAGSSSARRPSSALSATFAPLL